MGAGEHKDGPRGHIFLRQNYIEKTMSNKKPDETRTAFIERCIDFTIEYGETLRTLLKRLLVAYPDASLCQEVQ